MRCDELAGHLAAAGGADLEDTDARHHVEGCLRCQAEVAQYRKLSRALRTMRADVLTPAPGLVSDVLLSIEAAATRHAKRSILQTRKAAYVGGLAVASVAAAAGGAALVLASRSRRLRIAG